MTVTIRAATVADVPDMFEAHYKALEQFHDFYALWFKRHPRDFMSDMSLKMVQNPTKEVMVAEDTESHRVVGYVSFQVMKNAEEQKKIDDAEKAREEEEQKNGAPLPGYKEYRECLTEVRKAFFSRNDLIDAAFEKSQQGKPYLSKPFSLPYFTRDFTDDCMKLVTYQVMVHPDFQKRGIGQKLVGEALAVADREKLDAYLIASEVAHKLYTKMGYEDLGRFDVEGGFTPWIKKIQEKWDGQDDALFESLLKQYDGVEEIEYAMVRRLK